jgi:perosamine synthetase
MLKDLKFAYRGRVALSIILKNMSVGLGDQVALQAYTCSAVPEAIYYVGAKPVYIDINKNNLGISYQDLEKKIKINTNIKVLIVQYTFGINTNLELIKKLCKKKNIFIIEDCCHNYLDIKSKNSMGFFGDASFFSFEWGKPIVAGIGGAYYINNIKIKNNFSYKNLKKPLFLDRLKINIMYYFYDFFYNHNTYWILKKIYNFLINIKIISGNFEKKKFKIRYEDFTYHCNPLSKKIALLKLKKFHNFEKSQKNKQLIVINYLKKNSNINIYLDKKINDILLRLPIWVENKKKIIEKAKKINIELASWYETPVHPIETKNLKDVGYSKGSCPNAELAASKIVSIPILNKKKYLEHVAKLFTNEKK